MPSSLAQPWTDPVALAPIVIVELVENAGERGKPRIRRRHLSRPHRREAPEDLAEEVLAPGGAFIAKVLTGGTERDLLARMKTCFEEVRHIKPPASRKDSAELYVVATGYRGYGSVAEG